MANVYEEILDLGNSYTKMNGQVGNSRQTCIDQVYDGLKEKAPQTAEMCKIIFPESLQDCPTDEKCYEEINFESRFGIMNHISEDTITNFEENTNIETKEEQQRKLGR